MEAKKNSRAELKSKQGLFFNLGLVLSLSVVIVAFEWKVSQHPFDIDYPHDPFENDILLNVPITQIEQKQPPKPSSPKNQAIFLTTEPEIVDDSGEETTEISVDPDHLEREIKDIMGSVVFNEPEVDVPVMGPEIQAEFPGGEKAFMKYLGKEIQYPSQAKRHEVKGTIYVSFIVERDGSLAEIQVLKGLGYGLDEEVIRVIKMSPKWKPAKQSHRLVRQRMMVPVKFDLR